MIDNRRYLHDTQFISHFLDIVKGTRPRPSERVYAGTNPPHNMRALVVGVAAGMHYIHSSSPALIHGELKPSNILLFGHKFDLHGTPHYLGLRYAIDVHCTSGSSSSDGKTPLNRAKITDVGISHDLANDSAARGRGTTENETARTYAGLS
jgi:serine/threonine protein kinase